MTDIKKPEKTKLQNGSAGNGYFVGHNQACEYWEAYHNQEIQKLKELLGECAPILKKASSYFLCASTTSMANCFACEAKQLLQKLEGVEGV